MEPRSPALGVQSHSHVPPGRLPPKAPRPEVHGPSPGWGGQQPEGDDLAEAPELRSKEGLNLQRTSFMGLREAGAASLLGVQNMESAQAPGVLNELGQLDPPASCCFQPRGWRVHPGESGADSKGLASSPTAPSDHTVVPDHDSICRAPGPRPGLSHLKGGEERSRSINTQEKDKAQRSPGADRAPGPSQQTGKERQPLATGLLQSSHGPTQGRAS